MCVVSLSEAKSLQGGGQELGGKGLGKHTNESLEDKIQII